MVHDQTANPYETLGVAVEASNEDIRASYRRLAKRWHPDACRETGAEEAFKRVQAAFELLSDPDRRAELDRSLRAGDPKVTPKRSKKSPASPSASSVRRIKLHIRRNDILTPHVVSFPRWDPCPSCTGSSVADCPLCCGLGKVETEYKVKLRLPATTEDGRVVVMQGTGDIQVDGISRGDVLITVRVVPGGKLQPSPPPQAPAPTEVDIDAIDLFAEELRRTGARPTGYPPGQGPAEPVIAASGRDWRRFSYRLLRILCWACALVVAILVVLGQIFGAITLLPLLFAAVPVGIAWGLRWVQKFLRTRADKSGVHPFQ